MECWPTLLDFYRKLGFYKVGLTYDGYYEMYKEYKENNMEEKEFLEKFNYAPFDAEELAEVALKVKGELGEAAKKFLDAQRAFNEALEDIGFEWG